MRQASWEEMWRDGPPPVQEEKEPWWVRFAIFSWEELLTLAIVMIAFVTIVQSISGAKWVAEMPSLHGIAFLGLGMGLALSRVRINELLLHFVALTVGAIGVVLTATSQLSGSLPVRIEDLVARMELWLNALFGGGISNDELPFVVLVVSLSYLLAYLAAWSIFRWYNAWLGLIPGGIALLTNISYLPGQKSLPLMIYLFCAILLVARVHVLHRAREWRQDGTRYPDLISIQVLLVSIGVAFVLLVSVSILPTGSGGGALYSLWREITAPIAGPISDLGRVFASIDSKKGGSIHQFGSTLPLRGEITLGGGEVMLIEATETGFLRAQSYDFYTAQGWKVGGSARITSSAWPALQTLQNPAETRRQQRRPISIDVTTSAVTNVIVSAGQPLSVNVDTRVVFGADQVDVTSLRPASRLDKGSRYRVDSTVSSASISRLQEASSDYPIWITGPYLQLPSGLPGTIRILTQEVTQGAQNPYDRATGIEEYLRTFAIDTKIDSAPPGQDSVEYFLFTLRRGYFDYHASAMVVMLRTLGVPSRLAVGYTSRPQDRIPETNTFIIAEANAFAWPEVYFPGLGWVEFNPTPSEPAIRRPLSDGAEVEDDDEEDDLLDGITGLPDADTGPATDELDALRLNEGSGIIGRIIFASIIGLLAFTVAVGGTFQFVLQRGLGGLDYPIRVWEQTLRLARWAKVRPLPQETPRDIVARLRQELPDVQDLDYLGDSFIRSRYGRKELAPEERQRLTVVWRDVRRTLLQRLLRWK